MSRCQPDDPEDDNTGTQSDNLGTRMSGGKICFECRGDENRAIISKKEFTIKRVVGNQSARAPLFLR